MTTNKIQLKQLREENKQLREINDELLFWMKYIQSKDHVQHIHDVASLSTYVASSAIVKAKGG
jgi:hypothetical protein